MSLTRQWKWIALGLALLAAGYAWFDFHHRHSEAALLARANQYWEARRLNDYLTAYQLEAETANGQLAPDEVETRPEWGKRLYSYKLGAVEYYKNYAKIDVTTDFTIREFSRPVGLSTRKDVWTFFKGQWYHGVPERGGSGIRKEETRPPAEESPVIPLAK